MDLSLFDRGFSLFPLLPKTKIPAGKWKAYMDRRATPDELAEWAKYPFNNTGIATGAISGVIVLDCDNLEARVECERRGLPPTLLVATPRGSHFYFRHPGWTISNKVGLHWDGWQNLGVDIRGDGGFVVGPGSYYVPSDADKGKGKVEGLYHIERDLPLADMPDWLLELTFPNAETPAAPPKIAEETSEYGRKALIGCLSDLADVQHGAISHKIYSTTARIAELVAGGEITSEEGWSGLWEVLAAKGLEDEDKAGGTVQRAWAKGLGNPKCAPVREVLTPDAILGTRAVVASPIVGAALARSLPSRGITIFHEQMASLFADCHFVERQEAVHVKGRGLLKKTAFDTFYGGYEFPTTMAGSTKTKSAWEAFRTSPSWACPIVHDLCFRPDMPPNAVVDVDGRDFLNCYEPIKTKRLKGDPSRFLSFLRKLFPIDRDYQIITSYMAALVQNPGRKFQWWPVIQGTKGNGKTLIFSALRFAVGDRYSYTIDPEVIGKTANQFNGWVQGNLLVGVEEIFVGDQRHILETFKPIVTNARVRVEKKGKDAVAGDNYCNGIMLTNFRNGVTIDKDERRYAVFYSAQQDADDLVRDGMDGEYFPDLHDWMNGRGAYESLGADYGFAVVNDWLQTLVPVAEFNPAGLCSRAPQTSSTKDAIAESLGFLEQEVQEAIAGDLVGFRAGVVSSIALRSLFERCRKPVAPARYKGIMKALGYQTHPGLSANRGRFNNKLSDGLKPVLYFEKDGPYLKIMDIGELKAAAELALSNGQAPGDNVVNFRTALPPPR